MRIKQIESLLREKDYRYFYQQRAIDEISEELGVVAYRPNYHGDCTDKNIVLFYSMKDAEFNVEVEKLEKKGYVCYSPSEILPGFGGRSIGSVVKDCPYIYKKHFFQFENSDRNNLFSYEFANCGTIDLRGIDWRSKLKNRIQEAYERYKEES